MACTIAQPIRWVKLTFPPRVRRSWLLRILRLTSSSLAGTTRMDVAVGTPRLASMFSAIVAATPRRGFASSGTAGVSSSALAGALPFVAGRSSVRSAVDVRAGGRSSSERPRLPLTGSHAGR
jgi:hypothetical protein